MKTILAANLKRGDILVDSLGYKHCIEYINHSAGKPGDTHVYIQSDDMSEFYLMPFESVQVDDKLGLG